MIVRRIREHVAHYNWFAVAIDLAIVVVGVFLGMQVNNWNEARLDRELGQQYRARLVDELRATESALDALSAYAQVAKAHGVAAQYVLDHPSVPAGEPFLIDAYQASQVVNRTSMHSTYDEIISAGKLDLIGPPALRDEIANYYWRMDGMLSLDSGAPPYREQLRAVLPNSLQEAIRARCNETTKDVDRGLIVPLLPGQCSAGLDPAAASAASASLRATPGLSEALNRQLSMFDARILNYNRLAAGAHRLSSLIQKGSDR